MSTSNRTTVTDRNSPRSTSRFTPRSAHLDLLVVLIRFLTAGLPARQRLSHRLESANPPGPPTAPSCRVGRRPDEVGRRRRHHLCAFLNFAVQQLGIRAVRDAEAYADGFQLFVRIQPDPALRDSGGKGSEQRIDRGRCLLRGRAWLRLVALGVAGGCQHLFEDAGVHAAILHARDELLLFVGRHRLQALEHAGLPVAAVAALRALATEPARAAFAPSAAVVAAAPGIAASARLERRRRGPFGRLRSSRRPAGLSARGCGRRGGFRGRRGARCRTLRDRAAATLAPLRPARRRPPNRVGGRQAFHCSAEGAPRSDHQHIRAPAICTRRFAVSVLA